MNALVAGLFALTVICLPTVPRISCSLRPDSSTISIFLPDQDHNLLSRKATKEQQDSRQKHIFLMIDTCFA